jgi:RimJ/RimL family protein N-acetyltransferase
MKIRLLTEEDWQLWKQLRLESLQSDPISFGSSFEEESQWPDARFQERLKTNDIFVLFIDDEAASWGGFCKFTLARAQHRGRIWGMYTKPNFRMRGIAGNLLKAIIEHARLHVIQVELACNTDNLGALKLYRKHGFMIYGTELRCLKFGNYFLDVHLMVLMLA